MYFYVYVHMYIMNTTRRVLDYGRRRDAPLAQRQDLRVRHQRDSQHREPVGSRQIRAAHSYVASGDDGSRNWCFQVGSGLYILIDWVITQSRDVFFNLSFVFIIYSFIFNFHHLITFPIYIPHIHQKGSFSVVWTTRRRERRPWRTTRCACFWARTTTRGSTPSSVTATKIRMEEISSWAALLDQR